MTHRSARLAALLAVLALTAGGCGEASTGQSPSAAVIPPTPVTAAPSASNSPVTDAPSSHPDPATAAFVNALVPELEELAGTQLVITSPIEVSCGGEQISATSVQVQTTGDPGADQVLAILQAAADAAAAHPPALGTSLQISPDVQSSAQFLCAMPVPDPLVAQVVADGFAAEWIFTLIAPIGPAGTVSEAYPEGRMLLYSPSAKATDSDAEVLALLPDTWEAATSGAESLGWTYAYFRLGGGMLIDGLIRAPVDTALPEDLAEFWTDWSEFGWDVVGAGAESHPYVSPDPDGGLLVELMLKPGVQALLPQDEADFAELVDRLEGLGLGPVTVEVTIDA